MEQVKIDVPFKFNRLLVVILILLLIQNPTTLYFLFYGAYKFIYAICIFLVICDYFYVKSRGYKLGINATVGLRNYSIFIMLSVLILLVDALVSGQLLMLYSVQFIMKIAQFYVILYIIYRLKNKYKLLDIFYAIAVILSVLSLGLVVCDFFKWFPFSPIAINVADTSSQLYFYPPFGIEHVLLPMPLLYFRSYSIFTEPSYFGFFILPFMYYAVFKYGVSKNKKHIFYFAVLTVAFYFIQSTASFVTLFISLFIIYVFNFAKSKMKVKYLPVLLVAISVIVLLASAVNSSILQNAKNYNEYPILARRLVSFSDRFAQWKVGLDYVLSHPLGEGVAFSAQAVPVYHKVINRTDLYTCFTNIFIYVYYLGLIYIIPLFLLLLYVIKMIFKGMGSGSGQLRILSYMLLAMLIHCFSAEAFFSAYFLTMLALLYIKISEEYKYIRY